MVSDEAACFISLEGGTFRRSAGGAVVYTLDRSWPPTTPRRHQCSRCDQNLGNGGRSPRQHHDLGECSGEAERLLRLTCISAFAPPLSMNCAGNSTNASVWRPPSTTPLSVDFVRYQRVRRAFGTLVTTCRGRRVARQPAADGREHPTVTECGLRPGASRVIQRLPVSAQRRGQGRGNGSSPIGGRTGRMARACDGEPSPRCGSPAETEEPAWCCLPASGRTCPS